MKNLLFFLLLITFSMLSAHPASEIVIKYEADTSALSIDFLHKVRDHKSHFIDEVMISLNGEQIITQKLFTQDDEQGGSLFFKVAALKNGDVVSVQTNCNKIGKKTAEKAISGL